MTKTPIKHPRIILFILGAVTALPPLSIDMYLPSFPRIAEGFNVPISTVEFSLTSFFIGLALGQLFYGPFTDRFGRKLTFYVGLTLGLLMSFACALAPNIYLLIIFRFLQALGICAGIVTSRAVVRDMFDHHEAARYFSLLMAIMGIAPILAPVIGGYMAHYLGWHSIFLVTGTACVACVTLIVFFLPETHPPNPEVRFSRALHTYLDILKDKAFLRLALGGGFALGGMFAYITGSPYVLIDYFGVPAEKYGLIFGSNAFGLIACSQINRWLLGRYGFERVLKSSYLMILIAGLALLVCGLGQVGIIILCMALFLYVTSIGMVSPNSMAGLLAEQSHRAGAASALAGSMHFSIAFLASALIGSLNAHSPLPLCFVMGACALISFGVTKLIRASSPLP